MDIFLPEYAFIIVLWQVVQNLCVEKKWIPPGLSIEILRNIFIHSTGVYRFVNFGH
jgi:hypothetical protein